MNDAYEQLRQAVQAWAAAGYLPETLAYGFVVNALLAGLLIGPVLGGLGTLVVVKRFAFFSEAVATPRSPAWPSASCSASPTPGPTEACSATACCSASCSTTCATAPAWPRTP